jgi:predicted nucleic acid-binding protein
MMVSFDTNILVYATLSAPLAKTDRRAICSYARNADGIEHSAVANASGVQQRGNSQGRNRGRRGPNDARRLASGAACAGHSDDDLSAALDAVKKHRLAFWDAMLWGAAQRAGVRHLLAEDLQDGFELAGVRFVNPFEAANNLLIDEILPPG